jgi:pyruvoyl-dependent arginine decarboxylase (PvlArgDC)
MFRLMGHSIMEGYTQPETTKDVFKTAEKHVRSWLHQSQWFLEKVCLLRNVTSKSAVQKSGDDVEVRAVATPYFKSTKFMRFPHQLI